MANKPLGIILCEQISRPPNRNVVYKWSMLILTFFIYTTYHLSRKAISVVKGVLNPENCSSVDDVAHFSISSNHSNSSHCGWKPFDGPNGKELLGGLDIGFLFPYAVGMFISGHIAERVSLRYYLTCGMMLSGLFSIFFGLGFYWQIHSFTYYLGMQIGAGFVQATGWPSVVTVVANWFGKGQRGMIMGLWNSHTSFGNILGSVTAGAFADTAWGLSFIVPGIIISSMGLVVFFFLIPHPRDVCCESVSVLPQSVAKPDNSGSDQEVEIVNTSPHQEESPLLGGSTAQASEPPKAISFIRALRIPGVIEFSLCLFFAKLVSYVFLYWLPDFLKEQLNINAAEAANLSTVFDVGGILGGIIAGAVSDFTGAYASTCVSMLAVGAPLLYVYWRFQMVNKILTVFLLLICGFTVNGPYALITTAVSADLGTHESLRGNAMALATVTAIIDGTGSLGAAVGPLIAGILKNWMSVFAMLITADIIALLLLLRLVIKDIKKFRTRLAVTQ